MLPTQVSTEDEEHPILRRRSTGCSSSLLLLERIQPPIKESASEESGAADEEEISRRLSEVRIRRGPSQVGLAPLERPEDFSLSGDDQPTATPARRPPTPPPPDPDLPPEPPPGPCPADQPSTTMPQRPAEVSSVCDCDRRRHQSTGTEDLLASWTLPHASKQKSQVAVLTESVLGSLYGPRCLSGATLTRQARDVLLCRYHGDYRRFLEEFLLPAARLLRRVKEQSRQQGTRERLCDFQGTPRCGHRCCSVLWSGWPLCSGDGVLIHLSDPVQARPGDSYLLVRECPDHNGSASLVLRSKDSQQLGQTSERVLMDPLDWNDEQLTAVLQHLLVSVERGVEKLDWVRPWSCPSLTSRRASAPCAVLADTRDCSVQTSSDQSPDAAGHEVSQENDRPLATPDVLDGRKLSLELSHCSSLLCMDPGEEETGGGEEEEPDDGYCESSLAPPTSVSHLDQDLLHSSMILLTGSRDREGRSVVLTSLSRSGECPSPTALAEMILYLHSLPKKVCPDLGLCLLVDGEDSPGPQAWTLLDEALALVEGNSAGAVSKVLLWRTDELPREVAGTRTKWERVESEEHLTRLVSRDQLPLALGGTYAYDHQEWITFRKFLEPFVAGCRLSGRRLVSVMQELKSSRLPGSAQLTAQLLEQQRRHLSVRAFQDEHLRHLQEEGDTILRELGAYRDRAPHNPDYRDSLERSSALYKELRRAMSKLSRLAEKRMTRLQECLHAKTLAEESSQVLTWLCRRGEEALGRHMTPSHSDSRQGLRQREEDFEKFYFLAMRQIEKGNDLLEEASAVPDTGQQAVGMSGLTSALKQRLDDFTERLEDTRERVEDSAKCYQLLDKVYEWALSSMHFVQELSGDPWRQSRALEEYLDSNPPVSEDLFQEMLELSSEQPVLLESCQKAQSKCREAVELIHARQTTLVKLRQDSGWDDDEDEARGPPQPPPQPSFWSPPGASSTPFCPGRRRASLGSPFASCTAFPSNGFPLNASPVSSLQDSIKLDRYLHEKEEQLQIRGLITEDLTPQGPVATIGCPPSLAHNVPSPLSLPPAHRTTRASLAGPSTPDSRRLCPTWQLCDEALDKAAALVRDQNQRLGRRERLTPSPMAAHVTDSMDHSHSLGLTSEVEQTAPTEEESKEACPEGCQSPATLLKRAEEAELLARHRRTLMLVMRELTQTERDYVKSLEYIIDNYIPELLREDIPQALRGQRNVLFGNIEKIFEFHNQYFLQELERCEDSPFLVGQCFLQYERQFYLYALYNKNKPKSDSLMSEYGTSFFRRKQIDLKDKMDLASYLLKPVQRMGKYALLLKQILKECPEAEKESEHEDLKAAEEMVRFQLRHGNDLLAMDALRDCDVNVKEQGRLLRQEEFIVWQGRYRKSLRRVFLFEDLILFSKARRDPENKAQEVYQYKQSIKTTDVGFTEQVGDSPTKFEIWFRKRKLHDTYILQAPSADVKAAWATEISRLLWRQALKNREIRLAEMSSMGFGSKPCLDIKPSVDQISTRSINLSVPRASRYRNSIAVSPLDQMQNSKRPHSIISVSSSSSSSGASSAGGGGGAASFHYAAYNLGFEPGDSPRPPHRSVTQQSQCSTESGFCTDVSLAGDSGEERRAVTSGGKRTVERSDSLLSNESLVTHLPSAPCGAADTALAPDSSPTALPLDNQLQTTTTPL